MITTDYGYWSSWQSNDSPEDTCDSYTGGHATRSEVCRLTDAFREAINDALPDGVTLVGSSFFGPYERPDWAELGYPTDDTGELDIAAIIDEVDLSAIAVNLTPDQPDQYLYVELATGKTRERASASAEVRLCCGDCGDPMTTLRTTWRADALPDRSGQVALATVTDAVAAHYAHAHADRDG